jgi:hypothetical protein
MTMKRRERDEFERLIGDCSEGVRIRMITDPDEAKRLDVKVGHQIQERVSHDWIMPAIPARACR